ncbi:MAG: hypothetical protein WC755_09230 [Candidatus Woesearchaeota archaeon]|jgi:hypothetical protein
MNKKAIMAPTTAFKWLGVAVGGIGAIVLVVNLLGTINWIGALIGVGLVIAGIAIFKALTH